MKNIHHNLKISDVIIDLGLKKNHRLESYFQRNKIQKAYINPMEDREVLSAFSRFLDSDSKKSSSGLLDRFTIERMDKHIWTSFAITIVIMESLGRSLSGLFPEHAFYIQNRIELIRNELKNQDEDMKKLKFCKLPIFDLRDSLKYFFIEHKVNRKCGIVLSQGNEVRSSCIRLLNGYIEKDRKVCIIANSAHDTNSSGLLNRVIEKKKENFIVKFVDIDGMNMDWQDGYVGYRNFMREIGTAISECSCSA